jgi:hypothetical protein
MNMHWLSDTVRHLSNSSAGRKKYFAVATDQMVEDSKVLSTVIRNEKINHTD